MTLKNILEDIFILFFLTVISCVRENNIERQLSDNIKLEFNENSKMLKFRTKEDIRKFVGKYDEYSSLLNNYIENGLESIR